MKKIYLNYFTTKQSILKAHWSKQSELKDKKIVGTNKPIVRATDLGGIITSFDFETKTILNEHEILIPGGCQDPHSLDYLFQTFDLH